MKRARRMLSNVDERPRTGRVALLAVAVLLAMPAGAAGEDARQAIAAGNADYEAGRYAEALEKYESAGAPAEPNAQADLLHNQAAAHFKLGQLDEARELWVRAAGMKDAAFEAACHYNLGNCDYAQALQAAEGGDAGAAIAALEKAAARYRDALRLDPGLANARANLELAGTLQKQLEQSATSQPDSQSAASEQGQPDKNTSQPSQDQPPNPDQQGQEEQQDAQPSTQPDGQQQQQPESQPQSGEPQNQNANDNAEGQSGDQNQNRNDNGQDEQPPRDSQNGNSQNDNTQAAPGETGENTNDNAGGNDNQSTAEAQPATTQPGGGDEQPGQRNPLLNLTREEAERLLQKVRDMEKARRQALLQRERARHKPVDKDW